MVYICLSDIMRYCGLLLGLPLFLVKVARHPEFRRPHWQQELASLCVRGQVHQVVEALQKPELVKFASQPLDAAGQGMWMIYDDL